MVDIMKSVKWMAGGWNKKTPLTEEEMMEAQENSLKFTPPKKTKGVPINPTVYPLSPVKPRRKVRKLPAYLKKTTYRKGRVN